MNDILDLELGPNDANVRTVRDYLKALLRKLWIEEEGFSGKRPFGNGAWKYPIYEALIKAGNVKGKLDEDGYVEEIDLEATDKIILEAIERL